MSTRSPETTTRWLIGILTTLLTAALIAGAAELSSRTATVQEQVTSHVQSPGHPGTLAKVEELQKSIDRIDRNVLSIQQDLKEILKSRK